MAITREFLLEDPTVRAVLAQSLGVDTVETYRDLHNGDLWVYWEKKSVLNMRRWMGKHVFNEETPALELVDALRSIVRLQIATYPEGQESSHSKTA